MPGRTVSFPPVFHGLCPLGLYIHCPRLPSCCSIKCSFFSVSHIIAGVWFCSAARKLLEVSVYEERDAWHGIWTHRQSAGSSDILYWLWGGFCAPALLPFPISFSLFVNAPNFSISTLSHLTPSCYPRPTTLPWAGLLGAPHSWNALFHCILL